MFGLLVSPASGRAQSDDPLQQHYTAAGKFLQSGDAARASVEYKAFLSEALHRIANGKADAGEFDAARPLFDEALAFSPTDLDLQFDYAKTCFDADKLLQAKSLAQAVANSSGASRAARFLFARVLFHLGEFEPARQQLEKVFVEKQEFNVGYLLAKTYLLLHQEQAARDLLEGLARNFGDTPENRVYFGRIYSETDHQQEAIAEFHRAMTENEHAPDAHYYLGLAYLGHNESAGYVQAIPEFRAELQLNPSDFRSHYMLGYIALKQRNFPDAESELSRALASAPRDVQSLLQLAEAYTETNRPKDAEKELREAISIATETGNDGQAGRAHYQLGRILEKTGRSQEAVQEMKSVAEIQKRLGPSSAQVAGENATKEAQDQPKQKGVAPEKLAQLNQFVAGLTPAIVDAYSNLGAISINGRDFAAAAKYYQSARSWDASRPGLDHNLGLAFFYSGQYADAVPPLRRHLQTQPNDLPSRSMLAFSLYKTSDFRGVIETLQPVSSQISGDRRLTFAYADSYYQLGKLQVEADQTESAIASLEAAAKLNPQNPAVHQQLALAYRHAGREVDAQKEEKTLQMLPSGQPQ
jgi:tetratricopeptide (TPR) repeat protein